MDKFIAYCGLDCEKCDAYLATKSNDNALREKVAKLWSEWNNADITPEMINCGGCRMDGVKTPYCDRLCQIRQCALNNKIDFCGNCEKVKACEKVAPIAGNNEMARKNLGLT